MTASLWVGQVAFDGEISFARDFFSKESFK
jgi:hypothetical protein